MLRLQLLAPLRRVLPSDAVALEADRLLDETSVARINDRAAPVTVAVTRFAPLPTPTFVSRFNDLADLRQAVLATSCIPYDSVWQPRRVCRADWTQCGRFYFAKAPCIFYRGAPAVDGFFASPREYFGAPETTAARTIRICPFPAASVGLASADVIAPAPAEADMGQLFACALGDPPATDDFLRALYARGQRDAPRAVDLEEVRRARRRGELRRDAERVRVAVRGVVVRHRHGGAPAAAGALVLGHDERRGDVRPAREAVRVAAGAAAAARSAAEFIVASRRGVAAVRSGVLLQSQRRR